MAKRSAKWKSFTPKITPRDAGTATGKYKQIGKVIHVSWSVDGPIPPFAVALPVVRKTKKAAVTHGG